MWLGHRLATYLPIGKIVMCLASKLTSIYSQSGASKSPHDGVDSLPGRRRFRFTQKVGQFSGFHKFCKDFPCDFVERKQSEQESGSGHIGGQVPHFPLGRPSRCISPRQPRHDAVNCRGGDAEGQCDGGLAVAAWVEGIGDIWVALLFAGGLHRERCTSSLAIGSRRSPRDVT